MNAANVLRELKSWSTPSYQTRTTSQTLRNSTNGCKSEDILGMEAEKNQGLFQLRPIATNGIARILPESS